MPNKKHERKAKHQIRQKNTKYAKKNTKYPKKYTKYANKTPTTPKNTKYAKKNQILQIFIYAVLSRKNILFQIYALFGVLFTGLKSMVVYQKRQISCMRVGSTRKNFEI